MYIYTYIYIRNSFDAGAGVCFAGTLQIRMPKVRFFMLKRFKMDEKGIQNDQHGTKREPQMTQGTFKNTTRRTGSKK